MLNIYIYNIYIYTIYIYIYIYIIYYINLFVFLSTATHIEEGNRHFPEEICAPVAVFVVNSDLQHRVDVLHVAGTQREAVSAHSPQRRSSNDTQHSAIK